MSAPFSVEKPTKNAIHSITVLVRAAHRMKRNVFVSDDSACSSATKAEVRAGTTMFDSNISLEPIEKEMSTVAKKRN